MYYAVAALVGVILGWWLTRRSEERRLLNIESDIEWLTERHNLHTHRETTQPNLVWPGLGLEDEEHMSGEPEE